MDYSTLNKDAYEVLADEYESRVPSLMPITNDAMGYFASHLKAAGKVLDIGCAVGIAMSILREKGFQVSGIEISPKMAEYARKRNPGANIIVGDFLKTDFDETYDGILTFAFIHLFPKEETLKIFEKIKSMLNSDGIVLVSTTESKESKEGWYEKGDYDKKVKRFRKFWTEKELEESLTKAGFKKLDLKKYTDPYNKTWMDFIVQKS
jgi:cyclopropane fatty-acyl-phospholipid synthase-like methyltransferase